MPQLNINEHKTHSFFYVIQILDNNAQAAVNGQYYDERAKSFRKDENVKILRSKEDFKKLNNRQCKVEPKPCSATHGQDHADKMESLRLPKFKFEETKLFKTIQSSSDFINMFGKPLGLELNYNWKINFKIVFSVSLLLFTWTQLIRSQYLLIINEKQSRVLEVFAIYGIALSCVFKIVTYMRKQKEMNALLNFILKICQRNTTGTRIDAINNRLMLNLKFYKCMFAAAMVSVSGFLVYPITTFVIDHQFVAFLPIEIIFVDQSTLHGFFIANFIMGLMGVMAWLMSVYFSLIFIAIISNYGVTVDIIEEDMKALDDMWSGKSETSTENRYEFLKNICRKRQDMFNYIARVKQIYDKKIFVYFFAAYVSQIICLFEIVKNQWIPGFGIAYGIILEMEFYCLMGTRLSNENERLCFILQQSNWYQYDQRSKKLFLILLQSCMNAEELWIGPLAPLNVCTGTQIAKSIYTYYTILVEVM